MGLRVRPCTCACYLVGVCLLVLMCVSVCVRVRVSMTYGFEDMTCLFCLSFGMSPLPWAVSLGSLLWLKWGVSNLECVNELSNASPQPGMTMKNVLNGIQIAVVLLVGTWTTSELRDARRRVDALESQVTATTTY